MVLHKLSLSNFRNYESLSVQFSPGINHIIGENGQGKTNLLESIYCLGLAKSFRSNSDADLIKNENTEFQIFGEFYSENKVKHKIGIVATKVRKAININRKRVQKHSQLIGKIPVVLFSPEDHKITSGPPAERRKWLDIILSQSDQHYLKNLQTFKRALKQKNNLLDRIARKEENPEQLNYWNSIFVDVAEKIIAKRMALIENIQDDLAKYYKSISSSKSTIDLGYHSSTGLSKITRETFEKYISDAADKEISAKTALFGPHRDDLVVFLNKKDVRKHASRGEHKSILLALKIVEYNFLHTRTATKPILLLDDIYSELDFGRQKKIITHLSQLGQTFITTTFHPKISSSDDDQAFLITNGSVEEYN
ncbi:MAG: DNA replication/repair protein RecF [Calditrichaeota bacterium]|nr:MAG: DNA replication/repair protein RecF [Calditrichota bacterium]